MIILHLRWRSSLAPCNCGSSPCRHRPGQTKRLLNSREIHGVRQADTYSIRWTSVPLDECCKVPSCRAGAAPKSGALRGAQAEDAMSLELNFDHTSDQCNPAAGWYDVHLLDADWVEITALGERCVSWSRVCDLMEQYKSHIEGEAVV